MLSNLKKLWMGLAAYPWTAFWGKFFSKKSNSGEFPQIWSHAVFKKLF